jgi:hypothetical protein
MKMHPTISPRSLTPVLFAWFAVTLTLATPLRAQSSKLLVDLHAGAVPGSTTFDSTKSFPLYDETAHVATRQNIGSKPMFDVRFGYRITPKIGAGVSISGAQAKYDGAAAATIPNPLVINKDAAVTQDVTDMARRELGYHLQLLYFVPVGDTVELTFGVGPSFVQVQQPVITVDVIPGTQKIDVSVPKNKETVTAVNIGLDAIYKIAPRVGAGLFVRYLNGKKDFADIANVSVNGTAVGASVRVNF